MVIYVLMIRLSMCGRVRGGNEEWARVNCPARAEFLNAARRRGARARPARVLGGEVRAKVRICWRGSRSLGMCIWIEIAIAVVNI